MRKHPSKGRIALRVAAAVLGIAVVVELALAWLVYESTREAYPPVAADAIVVLGARVHPDGALSLTLSRRTERAFEAYKAGLAPALIVCGGQGADEPESEARAMADYLMELGAAREDIYLDDQSTSTRENLRNARTIMEEHGMETALVVTSDYHIRRALWLCADAGLTAYGYPSKGPDTRMAQIKALAQEAVSWVKYALLKPFA